MVPKQMEEILDKSFNQTKLVLGERFDSKKMCQTKEMKKFIEYVDDLESQVFFLDKVARPHKVVTLRMSEKQDVLS